MNFLFEFVDPIESTFKIILWQQKLFIEVIYFCVFIKCRQNYCAQERFSRKFIGLIEVNGNVNKL